ncbi:NAAT family transporter [bacterium]|nr:NAAT family transporter [bacterium]MBU1883630.1 NAAT family transporter [bacterium]
MDHTTFIHIFITLVSIMNPLGVIPIFLAIAADQSPLQKKKSIKRTVTAVILILLISAYGGNYLLSFFGIDIDSFRIAGGILLLLMSIHMLQAKTPTVKTNEDEQSEAVEKDDIAVVPLAIPLLAGPGSISTVILFSASMPTLVDKITLGIIIALAGLLILPTLLLSKPIGERLGSTGLNIATRIMGLILASISVKFILEGVLHFLKGNI